MKELSRHGYIYPTRSNNGRSSKMKADYMHDCLCVPRYTAPRPRNKRTSLQRVKVKSHRTDTILPKKKLSRNKAVRANSTPEIMMTAPGMEEEI